VAVLLVSPNFLESGFIADEELPPLLGAAEQQGVKILWIPLRASSWKETAIEKFQAVIAPARPLNAQTEAERDESWVKICARIKEALA
jgi:hypothetical protein